MKSLFKLAAPALLLATANAIEGDDSSAGYNVSEPLIVDTGRNFVISTQTIDYNGELSLRVQMNATNLDVNQSTHLPENGGIWFGLTFLTQGGAPSMGDDAILCILADALDSTSNFTCQDSYIGADMTVTNDTEQNLMNITTLANSVDNSTLSGNFSVQFERAYGTDDDNDYELEDGQ